MSVINITEDQMKRFQRIRDTRPQDSKARDTFDYILRVFEESPIRIDICKNLLSQRTGVETLGIITPSTLADKLTRDALKTTSNAIRKAYPSEETKA